MIMPLCQTSFVFTNYVCLIDYRNEAGSIIYPQEVLGGSKCDPFLNPFSIEASVAGQFFQFCLKAKLKWIYVISMS